MLDKVIAFDQRLFVFLNTLGSTTYDGFWEFITNFVNWTPLFLLLLVVIYKKIGAKQTLILLLVVGAMVAFTDQFTNLIKHSVQRLRPCNTESLKGIIRVVIHRDSFSFFSGHAANTMAVTVFVYLQFKRQLPQLKFLFLWPLVFAYSRIYLGLHFPLDILAGFAFGSCSGFAFFKLYGWAKTRYSF